MENSSEFAGKIFQLLSQLIDYEETEIELAQKFESNDDEYLSTIHEGRAQGIASARGLVCAVFDILEWESVPDHEDSV